MIETVGTPATLSVSSICVQKNNMNHVGDTFSYVLLFTKFKPRNFLEGLISISLNKLYVNAEVVFIYKRIVDQI